ncbi:hypothetical protein [Spirulina sp. 06S082]|uniref:hypothetical protein n=1 Tax=Spirulina sp. 06S082 TaxID=3110248 RepID=UPI002B2021F2|nr:hypothetical protein [Spirulina sp. 06S082]MEA5467546.1 hypothetical protein [Spirulina sp. 06S082]
MPLSQGVRNHILANPSAGAHLLSHRPSSLSSTVSNLPPCADNSTEMNNNTQTPSVEAPVETLDVASTRSPRKQPIPPPSEPRQYRAIGLVRGRYQPVDEQLTRGILLGEDGTEIDAVLLGRTISLIKNHLNLEESHLWVVYPRTRQNDDALHVQITGVWEPELLHPNGLETDEDKADEDKTDTDNTRDAIDGFAPLEDGYFSVRGEAIFYSQEEESIIIKINQIPRKDSEKKQYFKLHLKGMLAGGRVLGHFWDIHVLRQGTNLTIREAHDLGEIFKKRKKHFTKGKPYQKFSDKPRNEAPRKVKSDLPKPIKKSD